MGTGADPAGPVDCRVSRQTVVSYGAGTNSTAMVCEMVRRGVELWTNPGDVVLSPFAGIGSARHLRRHSKQHSRSCGHEKAT